MKKVKYPGGYNFYFVLDSKLVEISFENIRVEYKDFTWEEIMERCKKIEEGNVTYNVTNDLYIPFERTELEKYITNTEKKVLVYADIKYRVRKDKIGAGIEICIK